MSPEQIIDAVLPCMQKPALFHGEREAILATLRAGEDFGYGNLMAWLQTAWAITLEDQGLRREAAIEHTLNRTPYPWPHKTPNPKPAPMPMNNEGTILVADEVPTHVSRIRMARLYSCGRYEHVRYELDVQIDPQTSARAVLEQLQSLMAALAPMEPDGIPSEESLEQAARELEELQNEGSDHWSAGSRTGEQLAQYINEQTERLAAGVKARNEWLAKRKEALESLDSLGGTTKEKRDEPDEQGE